MEGEGGEGKEEGGWGVGGHMRRTEFIFYKEKYIRSKSEPKYSSNFRFPSTGHRFHRF